MKTETAVQNHVRNRFADIGPLWRNNSGVLRNELGVPVRFGLGNDSPKINKVMKSSDLIGITPLVIQHYHVGRTLGIFTAFECKERDWVMRPGDTRATAQLRFINDVRENGGFAGFVNDPMQIYQLIERY